MVGYHEHFKFVLDNCKCGREKKVVMPYLHNKHDADTSCQENPIASKTGILLFKEPCLNYGKIKEQIPTFQKAVKQSLVRLLHSQFSVLLSH